MFRNWSLTSVFLIAVGFLMILYGIWYFIQFRDYVWCFGIISLGIGLGFFGWTDGFTNLTPSGRFLTKFGIFLLVIGTITVGYKMSYLISS